ncbi:uncharacterized protein LOC134228463 [Saccostrea cucullata]|uniref:uncharacterized protein LOC134228463 n=1 Tax=Saccostrea cuccullata TaxID=36930 RepID=UPI002ED2A5C2
MDPGDQIYTLQEFQTWKTENLKAYLTKRGLSKEGTKEELVALCFSASKLNLPIIPTARDILEHNAKCYESILSACGIQDPLKTYEGWMDEKSAIDKWPPTFLSDITQFLLNHGDVSLTNSLLKDYKVGKAYEYFTSGWLQEVFYYRLTSEKKCILRAKCTPSQRIRDDLHDCWAAISEEDGEVFRSLLLGQTCNHVAALLFRIEAANQFGQTSCTMARCGWVQPKVMKDLEPQKISALCTSLKKSSRAKYAKSRPLVATEKKKYNPLEIEESNTAILDSLSIALRGVVPEACLFKGLPRTGDVPTSAQEAEGAVGLNEEDTGHEDLSVIDKFDLSTISKSYGSQNTCYEFLNFLPKIDDYEISTIEKFTVGQHENENWHRLRKGRITASKFYQVYTKVNSVLDGRRKDVQVDCSSLTKSIMCYTKINPNIKSLKYGRETEPLAICSYLNTYKKQHVNVSSRKCYT